MHTASSILLETNCQWYHMSFVIIYSFLTLTILSSVLDILKYIMHDITSILLGTSYRECLIWESCGIPAVLFVSQTSFVHLNVLVHDIYICDFGLNYLDIMLYTWPKSANYLNLGVAKFTQMVVFCFCFLRIQIHLSIYDLMFLLALRIIKLMFHTFMEHA